MDLDALTLSDVQADKAQMVVRQVIVDLEALTWHRFDL